MRQSLLSKNCGSESKGVARTLISPPQAKLGVERSLDRRMHSLASSRYLRTARQLLDLKGFQLGEQGFTLFTVNVTFGCYRRCKTNVRIAFSASFGIHGLK
jgi:hypothetical protein